MSRKSPLNKPVRQQADEDRPTLFFIMNYGSSIRNLVGGGVLDALVKQGFRVVLFDVNEKDRKAVEKGLAADCIIEDLGPTPFRGWIRHLQRLRTYIWRSRVNYGELLLKHGSRTTLKTRLHYLLGYLLRIVPAAWWRERNRALAWWPQGDELINKYRPVGVLISNPIADEAAALEYCRGKGIYTACVLESWDNLTNRGAIYAMADDLFVWNDLIREQAIKYHMYEPEHVHTTGMPSFDLYANKQAYPSEAQWRQDNGLPETGPVILYTLSSKHIYPGEDVVIRHLVKAREDGRLPADAHILVRLYPRNMKEAYELYSQIPGIYLQVPGKGLEHRINDAAMDSPMMLAATTHYSSVAINVFSSVCLDALCNDTPVVVVNYDATERPFHKSVRGYLVFEHIKDLLSFNAVLVADEPGQMIEHVAAAMADPEIRKAERQRCVEQETYGLDGRASERTAAMIAERVRAWPGNSV